MITESVVVDVSQDWVAACGLQERFMEIPRAKTQRLTYNARCRQMRALGGDCFHFAPLPGRRVALAVADASGKGLPAALIIANVQSSLRTGALFAPEDPAAVVTAVNRQLQACSPVDRYTTLFYGVFDENTRTLTYVNAGHNPVVVIRRRGAFSWLETSAPPVGLFAETVYRAQAVQFVSRRSHARLHRRYRRNHQHRQRRVGSRRPSCGRKRLPDTGASERCRSCVCGAR